MIFVEIFLFGLCMWHQQQKEILNKQMEYINSPPAQTAEEAKLDMERREKLRQIE